MNCYKYNCDLKYSPSDGGSVTWHEPTPAWTTSNPAELLPPGIVQVYEGSSVTLNWSYSPLRTEFPVFWEFLGILKNSQLCK